MIKHTAAFKAYCSLQFMVGNGLHKKKKKGGDKGVEIVWVVQQEPDELVILFHK